MASILCRKGETFPASHTHGSVAEVRACQLGTGTVITATKPDRVIVHEGRVGRTGVVFGRQGVWAYEGRAMRPGMIQVSQDMGAYANTITVAIDDFTVIDEPAAPAPAPVVTGGTRYEGRVDWSTVRGLANQIGAGRYAITEDGVTKFYRVTKGAEGTRWANMTFLEIQASDATFKIKSSGRMASVFSEILVDPKEAMLRYGRELGSCGHCGRTLTDPESIARGIGPVCFSKMGW